MSRIQDILAKAERDGTAQRTHGATAVAVPPVATTTAVNGSSALDAMEFVEATIAPPLAEAHDFVESAMYDAPPSFAAVAPPPVATPPAEAVAVETPVVQVTLHRALVAALAPHAAAAEQYRTLRTRIAQREETSQLRTLMITSPGARDGKSITAANLALTMAQEMRRILLVDCDLRAGVQHRLFGIEPLVGLAEVLAGEATLEQALVHIPECRLTLLPAGGTPQYPTELLGSTVMRRTLDALRSRFDRIVLDMPAVMPLADAGTVAPMADGILMVVRAGHTQRPALEQAVNTFEQGKLLGLVLNEAK